MPVSISPRRTSSSASGNIYGSSTSSSATGSSTDSTSRTSITDRSSSGYKSYLDRASSLSKLTSSSSSYSPSSYLGSSSYSSYSPRSYSTYRSTGSSLTGGSSGVGTYRSTFSSLGSPGSNSYDTTTLSRYGVNRRSKASDIFNNDKVVTKKPPSGSEASGGSSKDLKRLPGSSSSSSLALLVATSGLDLYEKYSPAHYKPNTQLDSGSRSTLNETGTDLEERRTSVGDIAANITSLDRPRNNRYSRLYSRNDSDETDNAATSNTSSRRSTSGTRRPSLSGRISASNSNTNLNASDSAEDIPTATFTLRGTRLRKSKVNDEEKKPLRNGISSDVETKMKYNSDASNPASTSTAITNGIDTVAYVKLDKLKISEPKKESEFSTTSDVLSSSSIINSGSSSKLKTLPSHETIVPVLEVNSYSSINRTDDKNDLENNDTNKPGTRAALAATINGMRRTGNGSHLGTTTAVATSISKVDYSGPQFKGLSSATVTSSSSLPTPSLITSSAIKKPTSVYNATNSSYCSSKLLSRSAVKSLVHRSGATTSVTNSGGAALSSNPSASCPNQTNNNNGSNSSLNSITNSGNNNMQTSLDQDDIKFIDSDEQPAMGPMMSERKCEQPRCCLNHAHSSGVSKLRVRPKSTILCSTSTAATASSTSSPSSLGNSLVFEKVNNYKYSNGGLPSSGTEKRNETSIDSSSIRASIEKFNSFSEQKRLPLSSVTLRSHSGSGSTSNLQHHRHSSDLDNCNLRLPSSGGGSLSRSPYRSSGSTAGKVITSIYPNASAAVSSSLSSSSSSARHQHHHHHHALSSSPSSTGSLPLKSSKHYVQSEDSSSYSGLSSSVDGDVSKKKLTPISGGLCDNTDDNSVRSSSTLRSVLPPASPTSSRYYDRESSRPLISSITSRNNIDETKKSTASDEENEGLCGLRNIGNTCFMNSVIQCLSHTSELTKFLRNYNATKSPTSKDQQILYEFAKLIKEMWTSNVNSVTPMELKRAFSAKHRMYSDYNQQDAQEFLRFFLDSLHGGLNTGSKGEHLKIDDNLSDNKKAELTWEWYGRHENSLIRDLFVGQLKSTLRCTTCGNTSVTFDPFWDLSVSLPSSSRCKLDACLDLFIREEILDGDEMPTCSRCQTRRKCTKSFAIQRFPKYLVIHLKRFSETRWSKLSNIVEFPTGERELNMASYGANANSNICYSLYAISNHMGSTAGGHYVAICKHPVSKKWHEFNDNLVSDSLSEHHLVSSSAYILFYERA